MVARRQPGANLSQWRDCCSAGEMPKPRPFPPVAEPSLSSVLAVTQTSGGVQSKDATNSNTPQNNDGLGMIIRMLATTAGSYKAGRGFTNNALMRLRAEESGEFFDFFFFLNVKIKLL